MNIEERLLAIAAKSSLKHVDVAAGDVYGLQLRMRYTASDSTSTTGAVSAPQAEELPDRRYLIASITKPVVAMAAVQLAADGHLALTDAVRNHLPSFHRGPLRQITIRHLLTHTSGLPDMLPNNAELRAAYATTHDFVKATAEVTPDFTAGTDCRYSSMGFAVLAEIIESSTQLTCAEHLHRTVFQPAGMQSSWLGLPSDSSEALMPTVLLCELPNWQSTDSHWSWNSAYWRTLGAPWGGMISTAEDLGRLGTCLLNDGVAGFSSQARNTVWSRAVVGSCMGNQTQHIAGLYEADRMQRAWGFGWRKNWQDHTATFSDFLSADAIGHWGATGTMIWIDPARARWCVILTTQPYEESQTVIQRLSNVVAADNK